jgi:hypothetical protein
MYTPTKRAYVPNPDIERRIAERDAFNADKKVSPAYDAQEFDEWGNPIEEEE